MTVIELGDVSGPRAEGPGGGDGRGGEFRQGTVRRLVLAALAVLCAVTLGGSARPGPPLIREMWSVPFDDTDSMTLHGGLVITHRDNTGQAELTAYDVTTGVVRWSLPTGGQASGMSSVKQSGVLLVPGDAKLAETEFEDGTSGVVSYGGTLTAVDPATGAVLWRRPGGYEIAADQDSVLVTEYGPDGNVAKLRLIASRDGTIRWERPFTEPVEVLVQSEGATPSRVVTATRDGEVTVMRWADGAPLLTRRLPWSPPSPTSGENTSLAAAPGLLIVNQSSPRSNSVAAYRIDTLEPLWQRDGAGYRFAETCGPVLCITTEGSFEAVDPLTGENRWSGTGYPSSTLVLDSRDLLITNQGDRPRPVLVDAATGRPRGIAARGWPASPSPADEALYLIDTLTSDPYLSVVTGLHLVTGRVTVLGLVQLIGSGRCESEGRHLACQSGGRIVLNTIG